MIRFQGFIAAASIYKTVHIQRYSTVILFTLNLVINLLEFISYVPEAVSKVFPHCLFVAPTGKSVGSKFCNLLGTNGFTRWSKNNK
jgi:hypothetical protein